MSTELTYLFDEDTNDLVSMDSIKRHELLSGIEDMGMIEAAASEIGLTLDMIADAIAADPRLEADIQIAQGKYKAAVLRRMAELAFQGSRKAVVGGKNRDVIIGQDEIPNDKALEIISRMQFADELAIVTRQRITAELKASGKDEVKADFSKLDRDDRKQLESLFKKAQKLVQKEDEKDGQ
ncbi:MAG: hypothetical protein ACR2QF_15085 [Geminicoccaceae bacterium]